MYITGAMLHVVPIRVTITPVIMVYMAEGMTIPGAIMVAVKEMMVLITGLIMATGLQGNLIARAAKVRPTENMTDQQIHNGQQMK